MNRKKAFSIFNPWGKKGATKPTAGPNVPEAQQSGEANKQEPGKVPPTGVPPQQDIGKMPKNPVEINARFEKILKYRGIQPSDKRYKMLMSKPAEDKWKIIVVHEKSMNEQENSHKIKETPEYYSHLIRENPSRENLIELSKMLRSKSEEWVIKYLGKDGEGLAILFDLLVTYSEKQGEEKRRQLAIKLKREEEERLKREAREKKEEEEEKKKEEQEEVAEIREEEDEHDHEEEEEEKKEKEDLYDVLQAECIKSIRTLMNREPGMKAFLRSEKSVKMIARMFDSENVKTKTQIFFLLSTVCMYSEDGFWLTLDSINEYKNLKQEDVRFYSIINSLNEKNNSDDWILYKIACMMFINTLVNAPPDSSTRRQLKKELRDLKLLNIIENLKNDEIDETLMIQFGVFEEEMDELDEDQHEEEEDKQIDMNSLENPMEILKLIRVQLGGSTAFEHFVNILQYFLIISGKSTDSEKAENMSILESIVKKAITMSEDGTVEQISVKELQLSDRVQSQQRKINDLQDKLSKLSMMIQNGKLDSSMVNKIASTLPKNAVPKDFNIDDPEISKAVMNETQQLLQKIKPPSASESLSLSSNVPDEYLKHVKALENEVKFLNYKLKTMEKKAKNAPATSAKPASGSAGVSAPSTATPPAPPPGPSAPSPAPTGPGESAPPPAPTGPGGPAPPPPPPPGTGGPPPPPPPPPGMGGPPPPPPPPGMGGPPPPPPAPGMGGPPPPPGMGGFGRPALPPLPNVKASVPMKAIFWGNIPPKKLESTIWLKGGLASSLAEIKLETSELEKLFSAKKQERKEREQKKVVEKITLIDPKKAQNSSIVLGSMRIPYKQIKKAILQLDEEKLDLEKIKALQDTAPTQEELTAVKEYQGDLNLLGPTEQFYREIMDIPRFEQRLTSWMFKQKFVSSISTVEPDIESMTLATTELMDSQKFSKLLQIILAVGNFINSGKKGSHGFPISFLVKLKDTRATAGKTDLLEYIINFVESHYPEVMDFMDDLGNLENAQRVVVQSVQSELNELKQGISQVGNEVELAEPSDEDAFRDVMIEFLDVASEKYDEMEQGFNEMQVKINDLMIFFGEDEKKFKIESFLGDILEFSRQWKNSYSELLRKRELEEKKREKEAKKKEKELAAASSTRPNADVKVKKTILKKSSGDGILDNSIDSLADGTAFKKNRKGRSNLLKGTNIDIDDIATSMQKKDKKKVPKKKKPESID